jgi:hypothetical protein
MYGITHDDYDAMYERQGGCCAACGTTVDHLALTVDHCHQSGRVRSLLCRTCNLALGYIKDDPTLARRLAAYLERHV